MTGEPLSPLLPQYCMLCGASLNYTEIRTAAGQGSASWKCSGCGEEDTDNWSEFDFTADNQTDRSAPEPDIEFKPFSPDYRFILPPPPPGGLTMPPTPSYFVNPEDARMIQEQLNREIREHGRRYEDEGFTLLKDADKVVAIVRAAHFPLFALNDLQGRFPFKSYGWGGGWSEGKTPRSLSSFSLR